MIVKLTSYNVVIKTYIKVAKTYMYKLCAFQGINTVINIAEGYVVIKVSHLFRTAHVYTW